jgi:predicted nucleic acid-binding protein
VVVIDASVVVDTLLNRMPMASEAQRWIAAESRTLLAPALLDAEVGQVLRRYSLSGAITAGRASAALDDYAALPIARYPHLPLLARAFSLRANMTFYDALYVALAEAADATLLTSDRRLAAAVPESVKVAVL